MLKKHFMFLWVLSFLLAPMSMALAKPSVKSKSTKPQTATTTAPTTTLETVEKKVDEVSKNFGYDKGFFIQSSDKKYKLVISGYGQFQFDYLRDGGENEAGFKVRRARLSFSGHLGTEKLTYKLQLDFTKFKDNLLLDYWMDYKVAGENFKVRWGQQTIPWIRQHIISSSEQQFVDRSLASLEFINVQDVDTDKDGLPDKQIRDGRDIGVVAHGKPFDKKMEYNVGFFNGSGPNSANFNNHFLYAGRAVYNIRGDYGYEEGDYQFSENPQLFFGASTNYNIRDLTNRKITQAGTETGLKYKGLSAQGELFYRHSTPGNTTLGTTNDIGYYAQVGYFAIPKRLEVAARASQVFQEGLQNDQAEFQIGLNGYILRNKILKLQSDYSVLPQDTKEGVETSQRFRLRLQTKF